MCFLACQTLNYVNATYADPNDTKIPVMCKEWVVTGSLGHFEVKFGFSGKFWVIRA